jgi:glycerate kinase
MRIVVAPDSFGGTASAAEAADAFAAGWREVAPADELRFRPMSDGGPGLIAALAASLGIAPQPIVVSGPTGRPTTAELLVAGDTAYVESAMACGLLALQHDAGDVSTATTYGVGELVAAATAIPAVARIVVGLGGSGTNDGGAGLWAGLGAAPPDVLRGGGLALRELAAVTTPSPGSVSLVAATDVDNPLLGLHGASAVYGPQKGADQSAVMSLDMALERWADLVESAVGRPGLRDAAGAGAAGGLGFGLLALGAERVSGVELVAAAVGLATAIDGADLVVTGEGRFDGTSLRGKVVSGVARHAQEAGVPCVVAAGASEIGTREAAANGIDEVYSIASLRGGAAAALAAGTEGIRELGAAVAADWSRPAW